jgi:hypothetical protein
MCSIIVCHLVMWTCNRNEVKQVQKRLHVQEMEYIYVDVHMKKFYPMGFGYKGMVVL